MPRRLFQDDWRTDHWGACQTAGVYPIIKGQGATPPHTRPMFFLEVNGIAQTGMMTRKAAIAAAERGHADRPDAIVVLMKFNPVTNRDIEIKRLFN